MPLLYPAMAQQRDPTPDIHSRLSDPNDYAILVSDPEVSIKTFTELPQPRDNGFGFAVKYELRVVADGNEEEIQLDLPRNFQVDGELYQGPPPCGTIILKRMTRPPVGNQR